MDDLSREFMTTASKMEVQQCTDLEALKQVTVTLIDLVQRQKGMIVRLMEERLTYETRLLGR